MFNWPHITSKSAASEISNSVKETVCLSDISQEIQDGAAFNCSDMFIVSASLKIAMIVLLCAACQANLIAQ